jgi:hypothetical protein
MIERRFFMLNKEEYKKTLVRMWDSVRDNNYKGKNDCSGVECNVCPVTSMCGYRGCSYVHNAYDLIELVEKWAKEHPIKVNGTKFLENYPEADVYGCDDRFIYIKFPFTHGAEDCAKIPRTWWESEVDDND